jgi:hypothetical protein
MSNLNSIINSYPIQYGIEFNQTFTLNPTVTGNGSIGAGNKFTLSNQAGDPVWYSNIGPVGGKGSWLFPNVSGSDGTSVSTVEANIPSTWADGDYSLGFWVMSPDLSGTYFTPMPIISVGMSSGGSTDVQLCIGKTGSDWKFIYSVDGGTTFAAFTPPISQNVWYFVTIRKDLANSQLTFTLDTQYSSTVTNTTTGTARPIRIGAIGALTLPDVYISNFYIAPSSVIGPTQQLQIYNAGITPPRVVKYWNGSAWITSSDQKVYNGTAWVDWNAQRWAGGPNWVGV